MNMVHIRKLVSYSPDPFSTPIRNWDFVPARKGLTSSGTFFVPGGVANNDKSYIHHTLSLILTHAQRRAKNVLSSAESFWLCVVIAIPKYRRNLNSEASSHILVLLKRFVAKERMLPKSLHRMYNVGNNGFIVCFPPNSVIAHVASNLPKLHNLQFSTLFQHHLICLFLSCLGVP